MKLFKKNENKKTTKLPMTGKVKKGFRYYMYGCYGNDICGWYFRNRLCCQ